MNAKYDTVYYIGNMIQQTSRLGDSPVRNLQLVSNYVSTNKPYTRVQ